VASVGTARSGSSTSGAFSPSRAVELLSEDVRNELAAIAPIRRRDALAEISGLFHTAGTLHLLGHGRVALRLDLASAAVARRAFSLLRTLGVESEIRTYPRHAFDRAARYQLHVEGSPATLAVLREAGIVGRAAAPLACPPQRVVDHRSSRAAYVRGAFLGGGSVTGPRRPHLEIRFADVEGASFLAAAAAREDVALRVRERSRYGIAYARGAEPIADALALAGASDAALAIDEHAVVGAARATANRLANADHANLVRTARAAHVQLRAIRVLEEGGELAALPEPLQEIARLRRRHPTASIRELADRCEPRASKAGAQRRLARLVLLAGDRLAP
jgi:DNA-binding protein WhiA